MPTYTKVKKIGSGSFGSCFLATSSATDETIVLKECDLRGLGNKELRIAREEVKVLQRLRHPNIVSYRDSYVAPNNTKLTIAMEYAAGGDIGGLINSHIKAGTRFAEQQVWKILAQSVDALAYCHHDLHLLHRDIKPENIFLSADGDVKIGDFGMSRTLASTGAFACTKVGTPLYMSPEIASGRPYDTSADVWALGCVAYAMMALQPPWIDVIGRRNANLMQLMRLIQSRPLNLAPLKPHYSPELCALVGSMVARSAGARPSFRVLRAAPLIRQTLEAIPPTPPSTPPQPCSPASSGVVLPRLSKPPTPPTPPAVDTRPVSPAQPPLVRLVGRPCDAGGQPLSAQPPAAAGLVANVRGAAHAARADAARKGAALGVDAHVAAAAVQRSFRRFYRPRSPTSVIGAAVPPLPPKVVGRVASPAPLPGPQAGIPSLAMPALRGPPIFQPLLAKAPPRELPPIDRYGRHAR